jgi:hypothetical protein
MDARISEKIMLSQKVRAPIDPIRANALRTSRRARLRAY